MRTHLQVEDEGEEGRTSLELKEVLGVGEKVGVASVEVVVRLGRRVGVADCLVRTGGDSGREEWAAAHRRERSESRSGVDAFDTWHVGRLEVT